MTVYVLDDVVTAIFASRLFSFHLTAGIGRPIDIPILEQVVMTLVD